MHDLAYWLHVYSSGNHVPEVSREQAGAWSDVENNSYFIPSSYNSMYVRSYRVFNTCNILALK